MPATATLTVLNRDPMCSGLLRSHSSLRVITQPDLQKARSDDHVFILALASKLDEVAEFARVANDIHHLRAFFVHADVEKSWIPQMLDRADLRILRNLVVHSERDLPLRILKAWMRGSQNELIAEALAHSDRLFVRTCTLERIEIPWKKCRALADMQAEKRSEFVIASDGSYIHWPESDVHLDLESLRFAIDPKARQRAHLENLRKGQRFGYAVRLLRERFGLRQTDFPEMSARQIRRIEKGKVIPRWSSLCKLAETHQMDLLHYLDELAILQQELAVK